MGEEEEEEEGEPHQDVPGNIMEDGCSGLTIKDVSGDGAQRELWTPFTSNTEEQLESRMSELGSFSHSFELEGKTTPPFSRLEPPETSHEDSESYCLLDEDSILSDSAVSTGYFPCYRTYVELPRYQLPHSAGSPPGDAEGRAGSSCDVSVQCSGWLEEDSTHPGTRASDTTQGSRDRDEVLACETIPNALSTEPLPDGNRLTTPGKEFEGQNDGDSSQQRPASEKQPGCGPEIEASGSGQERGSRKPSLCSRPSTSSTPVREAPRSTPSRLSLRSLVSWVRKIFRRSSAAKAQAGSSRGTEEDRGQPGSRLRWWIYRRRNRIYPH